MVAVRAGKLTKFFDRSWAEVPQDSAAYAVELTTDREGRVLSSRHLVPSREGEKAKSSSGRWVTIRGRRVFVRKGGARPGGASVVKSPSKEQVAKWREQIEDWDGPRRGVAGDALYSIESDEHQALVVESGGELKAIAAFQEPYFVEGGIMGPRKIGHSVTVPYLATKERGYGLRLMQELAQRAAEDGGLRFNATDKSRGFYEAIGMGEYAQGGNLFNLTFEQARQWLETSGQKAKGGKPKRKVPEWLAESMEPDDGVFIVKRGEGVKARGRGGSYGRWRTLKGGRPVFITGGTPEGGLSIRTGPGVMDRTLFDTFGDIDPDRVDKFIHDFEELPSWATKDITNIEMYEQPGAKFTAGGEDFQTGMDYTHSMGRIRVFQANEELSARFTNEGLYHEVGHNLDKRWRDGALEEQKQSFREHRDWYSERGMVFNESHRSEFSKAYPLAAARRQWLMSWAVGEDGISPYSSAWAKEDNSGETIAEFARFYFGGYARGGPKTSRRNVGVIGDEKGAPNLARAFADAMEALAKG